MERQDWDRRYEGRELIWSAQPNRFLAEEVGGVYTRGRALDLGCGEGRNAVWLSEQGWEVTAVDFSEVGLAKGERLARERRVEVTWVAADLREYVPPQDAFQLVALLYVHLPAAERAAVHARAASALAPGGLLLVVGHDSSNIAEGHGGPQDPAILFTPQEVVHELPGLDVERAERVRRSVSTPEGSMESIDALVRARRAAAITASGGS